MKRVGWYQPYNLKFARNLKMIIRDYQPSDCKEITELFYNTVHTVNAKDYTKEQLDVWAIGQVDLEKWNQSLQEHYSIVAIENEVIVGFGDIDKTGYLDRLFVHADYQGKGIATGICNQLEQTIQGNITTHSSITAKPFFEKRGYRVIKEQQVERQGIFLTVSILLWRKIDKQFRFTSGSLIVYVCPINFKLFVILLCALPPQLLIIKLFTASISLESCIMFQILLHIL